MNRLTLTSTTALMIGLSISSASAQDAAFPCALPDGSNMTDAQALAEAIGAGTGTVDLVVTDDPAICGSEELAAAQALILDAAAEGETVEEADAALEAEPETAPSEPQADPSTADAQEAPAVEADPVAEIPAEAPADQAAPSEEAAPADAVAPSEDTSAPDVSPNTEANVDAETAVAPEKDETAETVEPSEEPAASDSAPADEPAAAETEAQTQDESAAATEEAAPAEDTAEASAEAETDASASQEDVAASDEEAAPEVDAAVQAAPAADTPPEPSAEELAARDARRAERAAARQQSEAATAEPDSAEVVTEEVETEDVRSADEDFDTQVLSDTATAEDDNGGLSRFEQALLLGLGAATVGAILNNGDAVVSNSGDRVIVEREGELRVLRDDNTLLRQPGTQVATQTFDDGSTLTTITRDDGSFVTTIRAADGTVLRRTLTRVDGTQVNLIDDLGQVAPIDVAALPDVQARDDTQLGNADDAALRDALTAGLLAQTGRAYSLEQVRDVQQVRVLAPQVELDTITFASGSAAIQPSQAEELGALGRAILGIVENDPSAVFLIEGHTDAVGDAAYNLGLSDRRAETVALALTQYFDVPPENLVTQGYGEAYLKVRTLADERQNRRAAVRNITALLRDS